MIVCITPVAGSIFCVENRPIFSERNSFKEDGSNYSFYEENSFDVKYSSILVIRIEQRWSPSRERNSFIERVLFFYESFFYEIPLLNVFSCFMIYESSPQPITWNKLYVSNTSPENSSLKKALRKDRSIFNSKN